MSGFAERIVLDELARRAFAPYACMRYGAGLELRASFDELARYSLGVDEACRALHVEHDEMGAPLLVDSHGAESSVLISLTDEGDVRGIAWAEPGADSDVVGVGIDLAALGDFPFDERAARLYRHIFTNGEWDAIRALPPACRDLGATLFFSAKEAAFKSASQRIRATFRECGSDPDAYGCPYFELRDIETIPCGEPSKFLENASCMVQRGPEEAMADVPMLVEGRCVSRGIAYRGNAAKAFEFLGLNRIETWFSFIGSMVVSLAVAFR